jgi:hypothetical protein
MNATYAKNEKVVTRLSNDDGIVVDREDDARHGWAYQVQFADGSKKWFRSTDLYAAK